MTESLSNEIQKKDRFHALDYQVMKHAFGIHNRMGNCHDEEIYRNELQRILNQHGIHVQMEVPLTIEFSSFRKTYLLDLLIEQSHIYELKALPILTNQCRSQIINYQLIAEKPYGKLVNFGGNSVDSEFSTSTLSLIERQDFTVDRSEWEESTDRDHDFYTLAHALISDWGTRLNPALYSEALLNLFQGAEEARAQIISEGCIIGTKLVRLASPDIAFKFTTSKKPAPLKIQFHKFLNHTSLQALYWVNLNQNQVSFHALRRK